MKSPLFFSRKAGFINRTSPSDFTIGTGDLDQSNALRLGTLLSLGGLELDCLAIFEIPKPFPDNAREMYEEILATFVRSNEAIAFLLTEPLYRALSQSTFSLLRPRSFQIFPSLTQTTRHLD
jgi:hypothetical protein